VKRDLTRLAAAAARVQADLRRTTEKPWVCSVGPDYLLSVTDGVATEHVPLEAEVEDEDWFTPPGATASEQSAGLDADADETLATEVTEVLWTFGVTWPLCPEHCKAMGVCSGWWYCEGEPYHDLAEVGSLPDAKTSLHGTSN
jgi:hypothetical protein